jgi:hypothetical protein
MEYIVNSLENTSNQEKDFNLEYHQRYLGKQGEIIQHDCKSGVFINFICLGFDKNEQGQFTDVDWFHRDDLGIPSLWGFTKEDVERWLSEK